MTAEEQGSPLFVAPQISAMSADAAISTFMPLMTMMARAFVGSLKRSAGHSR